jgi:hypothetical protein
MSAKDELRQVEEDLARLKDENQSVRDQVGDMGATDQVEVSAMIAQADEQSELIAQLEQRRADLQSRVEEEG